MSDRRKEIVSAAKKIVQETLRVTDDYFISHGQDEISWFRAGATWADSHPIDPSDLIIDLIHQRSILEKAKESIQESKRLMEYAVLHFSDKAEGMGDVAVIEAIQAWLQEFETVMKREGMQK